VFIKFLQRHGGLTIGYGSPNQTGLGFVPEQSLPLSICSRLTLRGGTLVAYHWDGGSKCFFAVVSSEVVGSAFAGKIALSKVVMLVRNNGILTRLRVVISMGICSPGYFINLRFASAKALPI
jgi:hypothetical protein